MSQTTVRPTLKPSYQTLTTVLITLIVLMPPLPPSPEPPWQQETTGRNVITQICMMTVLSSVINLKWSTVTRNLSHKLLVSLKLIAYCQNCIYQDCCNVKNPKTTAKLSKKRAETSVVLIVLMLSFVTSAFLLLPLLNMKQVPEKPCLSQWLYIRKILSNHIWLLQ